MKITLALIICSAILLFSGKTMLAQAAITSQLDFGAQGANVTALQTYLASRPAFYPSGLVTGYFGALTQEGVRLFQANQGIVNGGDPESTGYGRVGPITMSRLNKLIDPYAPLMVRQPTAVSTNSATLSWITSEPAYHRVMYGQSWPFVYATAPSISSVGLSNTARITLTGLTPNTTYYYVRESVDAAGNIMWMSRETFTTD